jgi:mono/diheme cytochrome c family protein
MRRQDLSQAPLSEDATDAEIAAVANYVSSRFGSKASQLTAQDVAAMRKQTSP